jgi:putative NIF3 family GTP cyclohydrolase 1 type 2
MKLSALIPASQFEECRSALLDVGIQEVFSHRVEFEELETEANGLVNGVELRLSILLTAADQGRALSVLKQYSDRKSLSCELTQVENDNTKVGSGLIGKLPEPMPEKEFLSFLKKQMQTSCIRYTALRNQPIKRVALCGGAGGFLLNHAIRQKADIFITGDYKYHEFFDADGKIIIADIGHYESEQFTIELLSEIISKKFRNFAVHSTQVNTNPVNYFID